jgi:hypothetical protein
MREADASFDDSRSHVVEVWEAVLRNFDRLPVPHKFRKVLGRMASSSER